MLSTTTTHAHFIHPFPIPTISPTIPITKRHTHFPGNLPTCQSSGKNNTNSVHTNSFHLIRRVYYLINLGVMLFSPSPLSERNNNNNNNTPNPHHSFLLLLTRWWSQSMWLGLITHFIMSTNNNPPPKATQKNTQHSNHTTMSLSHSIVFGINYQMLYINLFTYSYLKSWLLTIFFINDQPFRCFSDLYHFELLATVFPSSQSQGIMIS